MNGIKLNEWETKELVENISRSELFEEINFMDNAMPRIKYPRYLKAVHVCERCHYSSSSAWLAAASSA